MWSQIKSNIVSALWRFRRINTLVGPDRVELSFGLYKRPVLADERRANVAIIPSNGCHRLRLD